MLIGQRTRKKHKKLDAIYENVLNENHRVKDEVNGGSSEGKDVRNESELRRSSRARRAPVILDASPSPPMKKRRFDGLGRENGGGLRGKGKVENVGDELDSGDSDKELSGWRSRLRTRGRNVSYKHLNEGWNHQCRKRSVENVACLVGEESRVVKSKRSKRGGSSSKHEDEDEDEDENDDEDEDEDENEDDLDEDKLESRVRKSTKHERGRSSSKHLDKDEDDLDDDQSEPRVGKSKKHERAGSSSENENEDEDDSDEDESESRVGKSKKSEKAGSSSENENEDKKDGDDSDEDQSEGEKSETNAKDSVKGVDGDHSHHDGDEEIVDGSSADILVKEKEKLNDNIKDVGGDNKIVSTSEPVEGENQTPIVIEGTTLDNDGVEDERGDTLVDDLMGKDVITHVEHGNDEQVENRPRIKEGRRCGLCGCKTDGKPPKRLTNDSNGSDHDTYSGSSASEEVKYDPWDGFGDDPGWLGKLLGPINDRYGIAGIWVHQHCAVWSPEVYFAGVGCLKNVRAALCRGRALKCTRCGRPGATLGCRVDRCPRTYHLPCARASDCHFDHRKFLIACADHRHLFQPHGHQYSQRIKKLKARKMKLEIKKLSNDASRRDIEAEEKWMEKCGEDEEFVRREAKRLQRDLVRIAPVYIGGSHSEGENLSQGWESVAGLQHVINCMKEVVIMPLLYPELFDNMGITPPRGVLLHGYPGTGKTLVVRALIGACARGDTRIAYFARKGADCLGKYVGDAERQLRLLFQVAERSQPSIIFFDEIDGLAPVRTRQQDQTHSSVVSTLLALMDGLNSRGSVVVIGATNRPDAVDPALRRPGRFDREIYFPLPSLTDRAAILSLHTKKWPKPVGGPLLDWIASKTVGFAGADLQALCAQVAVIALKRNCSWQQVVSCNGSNRLDGKRAPLPTFDVEERDWIEALSSAPPPCSRREAGMAANEVKGSPLPLHLIPCLLQPLLSLVISLYCDDRIWLPPRLYYAVDSVKRTVVSAMEKKRLQSDRWWVLVPRLVQETEIGREVVRDLYSAGIVDGSDPPLVGNSASSDVMKNICYYRQEKKAGYRILIGGDARSGQKHLASCLIHCFVGSSSSSMEMHKIDLATISQEGKGDVEQGISRILLKCAGMKLCGVFMPRIDLWAIHKDIDDDGSQIGGQVWTASQAWNSFVEQLQCICVSSSLILLATSELPYADLPQKICQFFGINSSNSEHATPRFCVELDGKFDRELLTQSSASELSRESIQQFIHLTHLRNHVQNHSSIVPKPHYEAENGTTNHRTDVESSVNEERGANQLPDVAATTTVSCSSGLRLGKEKSNLGLAISSFGYQVLRYPHFAELCWVTSKLKGGPSADISGPWKGWPFNSCIVRPCKSMPTRDSVAWASSNNSKGKDQFTSVTGLLAVGLAAYKGLYTSPSEVSVEVRKVMQLLVKEINERIQSGKDRYQYFRLLSQVGYLEDMVDNWAHSLRSLESDSQTKAMNPKLSGLHSPESLETPAHKVELEEYPTTQNDGLQEESTLVKDGLHEFIIEDPGPANFNPNASDIGVDDATDAPHTNLCSETNDLVCSYTSCARCTWSLYVFLKKIVSRDWESSGSCNTLEDAHDLVSSLSTSFCSLVRNLFSEQRSDAHRKLFESPKMNECQCSNSDNQIPELKDCACHTENDKSKEPNTLWFDPGLSTTYVFRDGVLVSADSGNESSLHCKYDKVCLCSLIELLVTSKQPLK